MKQRFLRNRPGCALRPLATSCMKDYKAHSLWQTSFAELPNRKPWSDGTHSITVWCFIIDCTVLLQGNRLDSTFAGKYIGQYFCRETLSCTSVFVWYIYRRFCVCLWNTWTLPTPTLCGWGCTIFGSWVMAVNIVKTSEEEKKRLCGLFYAAPWVMWTCLLWLKSKKLCATRKLVHLVASHNAHKFHPLYQHSWK